MYLKIIQLDNHRKLVVNFWIIYKFSKFKFDLFFKYQLDKDTTNK